MNVVSDWLTDLDRASFLKFFIPKDNQVRTNEFVLILILLPSKSLVFSATNYKHLKSDEINQTNIMIRRVEIY